MLGTGYDWRYGFEVMVRYDGTVLGSWYGAVVRISGTVLGSWHDIMIRYDYDKFLNT